MVPPGEVASPFLSTAPAVPAPCVLASFGEGLELPVVVPVVPFFTAAPPAVVLLFVSLPAVAALPCASAVVLARARLLRAKSISSSWSSPSGRPQQLIGAACIRSCIVRKAGAPRTHASAPRPVRENMLRIVTGDAVARQRRCASLSQAGIPEYATARKRTALKRLRQDFDRQPWPSIRWLTKLRAARSDGPGIRYLRHAGELLRTRPGFRLTINFPATVARRTRRRRRARLNP